MERPWPPHFKETTMADHSRDVPVTSDVEQPGADPSRRNLALALLGAFGGASLLEACVSDPGGRAPEALGTLAQAATGTDIGWVDSTFGGAQELKSKDGTFAKVVVARGYTGFNDGGGGIFVW